MGNERLLLGIIAVFRFLEFLFLLLGGFGTPWAGGPRRGFRKYLSYRAWTFPSIRQLQTLPNSHLPARDAASRGVQLRVGLEPAELRHPLADSNRSYNREVGVSHFVYECIAELRFRPQMAQSQTRGISLKGGGGVSHLKLSRGRQSRYRAQSLR